MNILQDGMWLVYKSAFKEAIDKTLKEKNSEEVMKKAKKDYKKILSKLPPFDKGDRFKVNIINCALLVAILKNLENKYSLEEITLLYKEAMDNKITKYFCTHGNTYTEEGQKKLEQDAQNSKKYSNPYSWKFTYEKGETVNEYTVKFYTCGICKLMKEYGFEEYIPAMCALDYDMAAMNNTHFTREYTLATGGPYCDCHYQHTEKK